MRAYDVIIVRLLRGEDIGSINIPGSQQYDTAIINLAIIGHYYYINEVSAY